MSARLPRSWAAFALAWLVGALPPLVQASNFNIVQLPSPHAKSAPAAPDSFKLRNCADLPIPSPSVEIPWCREVNQHAQVEREAPGEIKLHVTSVPVAAIVGATLIASMGIAQRVRRVRSRRG